MTTSGPNKPSQGGSMGLDRPTPGDYGSDKKWMPSLWYWLVPLAVIVLFAIVMSR